MPSENFAMVVEYNLPGVYLLNLQHAWLNIFNVMASSISLLSCYEGHRVWAFVFLYHVIVMLSSPFSLSTLT